ncbi:unnamed protein product [Rhizoctonia solani]|uniref:Uncharacterized protein n=1 Tax=Rhizoctonia solani TaxID=456999 RepID=A0A8H2XZF8_9AGAM|nr:unnamed protein product [Rhizoctonia solani]
MRICPESIDKDVNKLRHWIRQLEPSPDLYQYKDNYEPKGEIRRADYEKIRRALKLTRKSPTIIYIAGHTELKDGAPVYIPADHLDPSTTGSPKVIPYEYMAQLLLKQTHSAALLFVTEVCYCDNFLRLPYMLEYEGDEVRWKKTGHPELSAQPSTTVVHFAATAPGERSESFKSRGAAFTTAFHNINPREELSLGDIGKRLQEGINRASGRDGIKKPIAQHPKIYCSRIMDEPHFYKALDFYSPLETDSGVGGDSDSNA